MKPLLWVSLAAGAVIVTAAAISSYRRRSIGAQLTFEVGPISLVQLAEAQVIELVPLDVSGPLVVDEETTRLLEELADQALFLD
jgi:hypothetical protein